jgi:hypothetical protein
MNFRQHQRFAELHFDGASKSIRMRLEPAGSREGREEALAQARDCFVARAFFVAPSFVCLQTARGPLWFAVCARRGAKPGQPIIGGDRLARDFTGNSASVY